LGSPADASIVVSVRAVPGFVILLAVLTAVGFGVAKWGRREEPEGIYANGVFLTVDTPDVPPYAEALLGRLKTALRSGTRVVVYDCSASDLLGDNFFTYNLPYGYSLMGINVQRADLQSPPGCTRDPGVAQYFSFEHAAPADNGNGGCSGGGGARFNEGHLFAAMLERELRENGHCAF
jgi:hypothetical protein